MMGNSPANWRQQMKAARRLARQQARLYRHEARRQARAYRRQLRADQRGRLSAKPLAALGTLIMIATFAGMGYVLVHGSWHLLLTIFFGGLAMSSFLHALAQGRWRASLNSLVYLLAAAAFFLSGSWTWFLLALLCSFIISSVEQGLKSLFGRHPSRSSPALPISTAAPAPASEASANSAPEPPYAPYHQGYSAQSRRAVSAAPGRAVATPEAQAASTSHYTQPLISYPEESPQVLPPQSH